MSKNKKMRQEVQNKEKDLAQKKEFFLWLGILAGIFLLIFGLIKLDAKFNQKNGGAAVSDVVKSEDKDAETLEGQFAMYAEDLGLDKDKFKQDYNSSEVKEKIQSDLDQAQKELKINATPTFFINGEHFQPKSENAFKEKIQSIIDNNKQEVYQEYEGYNQVYKILENDWIKGDKNAKIIIAEYSNYTCPACSSWFPVVNDLVANEFAGKVKVVFRHFPFHDGAVEAAQAAEAAGMQKKFWEMSRLLFENSREWSSLLN